MVKMFTEDYYIPESKERGKCNMSIMDRLKKNSRIKDTEVLEDSKFFREEQITTSVPMLNVALSGSPVGGLTSGLLTLAGPSKHYKTSFALMIAAAYLGAKPNAVMIFYDSEFGSPETYFRQFGISTNRVLHVPIKNIEELKFDLVNQLEALEEGDEVIVVVDSIGNLASKKEIEDALDEKSVADMTRAKQLKGLFRMVTPYLRTKKIPMLAINHTYKEQSLFPKDIVSGGCVVGNTKIQTESGLKEVKNIKEGDLVATIDGLKEVTHSWNPETLESGIQECYEIEFEDGYKVTCSSGHKFLVGGHWVEAKNLLPGVDVSVL